uniref:ABC transmembrane type-2 domain-containing protein n=1 Tax=Lophocladia kuetzingii TaxID=675577 RepID=A0A1Z1MNQ0_9FLOR|nr:hypothetical protein [Lophocladia kuetzingii]ARW67727.1 hypothetical protein [Lophocladia kuetzingii]
MTVQNNYKKINLIPQKKIYIEEHKVYNNIIQQEIKTFIKRLYINTYRRPSSLIINIIQPLLWLILFGALFQNAPIYLYKGKNIQYKEFLNPGIIIFTAFNNSINAGLTTIFDREFGFLNRILTSPIIYKNSLILSSIIHMWLITIIQIITIITFNIFYLQKIITLQQILMIIAISTLIIINISNISISNAFILPGHIEFLALTTTLINIPTLFSSTALAPLSFMPYWLQIITCINPLTYAIEIIRNTYLENNIAFQNKVIDTVGFQINIREGILILFITCILSIVLVNKTIRYKYD